jgi:hypothetical protein
MILIPILILILVFGEIFIVPLVLKTDIERTLFLTICHTLLVFLLCIFAGKSTQERKNARMLLAVNSQSFVVIIFCSKTH